MTPLAPAVSKFIATSSYLVIGSTAICVIATTELALRALDYLIHSESRPHTRLDSYNFSANLSGALFYGLCAANIISGTAVLGGIAFTIYSLFTSASHHRDDTYITSLAIRNIIKVPLIAVGHLACAVTDITFNIVRNIHLPEHPSWYFTGALVAAVCIKTFFTGNPTSA